MILKNTMFFRKTLLGVLLFLTGPLTHAESTTYLHGALAIKVYTDLNLSPDSSEGVLYMTKTVSERQTPAYLYNLIFTVSGVNQKISLTQEGQAELFHILQESGVILRGVIGGSHYSWLKVEVSCSKENGYSCILTDLGEKKSKNQAKKTFFPSHIEPLNTYLINQFQAESNCHIECSTFEGQACGGRYGVCCHKICD